jgi:hypothetical protein
MYNNYLSVSILTVVDLDIASFAASVISSSTAVADDASGTIIYSDPEVEVGAGRGSAVR